MEAKNNKNGKSYNVKEIIMDATNNANGAPMVLYSNEEDTLLFVRTVGEFKEKFTFSNDTFAKMFVLTINVLEKH